MIGDSFVEAREVSIPEKFPVGLEEMAARELPHLDVMTSAFGVRGTGQINQLALYDEYVRHLRPKLIVLVFVPNDFIDNFPPWNSILSGLDPEYLPYVSAARGEDGSFRLRPPDRDYRRLRLSRFSVLGSRLTFKGFICGRWVLFTSWFLLQLCDKGNQHHEDPPPLFLLLQEGNASSFYRQMSAFTTFGINQFKERADRDGSELVILVTHRGNLIGWGGINEIAADQGIPVINQGDFIYRQGGRTARRGVDA